MERAVQERLSRAAISKFFKLARIWRLRCLSKRQLLGGVSSAVLHRLKCGQKNVLGPDTLTRVFLLLEISRALNILYGRKLADSWVRLPNTNPMFQGEPPLEYMVKGGVPALLRVRQLLDSRRAGH